MGICIGHMMASTRLCYTSLSPRISSRRASWALTGTGEGRKLVCPDAEATRGSQLSLPAAQNPVSLQLIGERLARGNYYLTLEIFVADLHRIFANARFYNAADSIFVKLANRLEDKLEQYLEANMLRESSLTA